MPARRPGRARAEVGQPAVVCLQTRPAQLEVVRVGGRCLRHERAAGKERRDRVREDDLGGDAVGLEVAHATVGVPVALPEVAEEVGEQDLVAVDPGVELVVVPAREEVAVLVDLAAAVAVGGDDDVAVVGDSWASSPGSRGR